MTALNTMTVSRALTWLKHFIPSWNNYTNKRAADVIVNGRSVNTGQVADEVSEELKATHQSVMDQVQAVYAKRVAINAANQETLVTVDGKEYTIANAMIYRQHVIPLLEQYVTHASNSITVARRNLADATKQYQTAVQAQQDPTEDALKSIKALFEPTMITNIELVEMVQAHIRAFKLELDAILSEKNSITNITV